TLFFQAEDGIRAFHVTGVQTCALPISSKATDPCSGKSSSLDTTSVSPSGSVSLARSSACVMTSGVSSSASKLSPRAVGGSLGGRSEERRVGKDEGCRWTRED